MAFQLKDLKKKELKAVNRVLDYNEDLSLTIEMTDDKAFQNAFAQVQEQMQDKPLTRNALSRTYNNDSTISANEAVLYVIGEYLVKDWSVLLPDGKPAPINGENFVTLCASVGDTAAEMVDFVTYIIRNFTELMGEFEEQGQKAEAIKKKPSKSGSGASKAKA